MLTFDDGRADSWTGADGILRKLHFNAVMFVDVGRVERRRSRIPDMARARDDAGQRALESAASLRQRATTQIRYGPGPDDYGPYYAYEMPGESFEGWQDRVRSDIVWGQDTLADHIASYRPLAFAPPFGSYGQDGTNDSRIPDDLLGWLKQRYGAIFTQDVSALGETGSSQPLGRIQVTRATTAGSLHEMLLSGEQGASRASEPQLEHVRHRARLRSS